MLVLTACTSSEIANESENIECNCGEQGGTMFHHSFEEVLALSTDVVIAQLVERRPFGGGMAEVEFFVSERIFGNASERIFVYLDNADISGWGGSYRSYEAEFETGVGYLLLLSINRTIVSNFHDDGYFLVGGIPIVNLDNPMKSTMYNQSIVKHSTDLDFSDPNLSRDQIVSFAQEMTRSNTPASERESHRIFIRSDDIEDIINESPEVLVVEINRLISSGGNCAMSSDIYTVTIVESLKGELEVGDKFELIFFMDMVSPGEHHIVAIRQGIIHPGRGRWSNRFTSRHGLFSLDQQQEIENIIANAPESELTSESDNLEEINEVVISIDGALHESVEDLAEEASHIIRGEVLEQRAEWLNLAIPREVIERMLVDDYLTEDEMEAATLAREPELVTISRIQVLEVFQGDHQVGDIIEVMQLGGEYGNDRWIVENAIELEVGLESILFLNEWEIIDQPFSLINYAQGAYASLFGRNERLKDFVDGTFSLETISETDPILVRVGDLIRIAAENGLLD